MITSDDAKDFVSIDMNKPRTLVVTVPGMIGASDLDPLRQVSDVVYHEADTLSEVSLAQMCDGFDHLMLNMDVVPKIGDVRLSPRFYEFESVKRLKSIAVDMTGVDYFSPQSAIEAGVLIQNIPHYSSRSVAESIISEILLHSRQRHLAYKDELFGHIPIARKGINLEGKTVGIVGLGSIGTVTRSILSSFGMNALYWSMTPRYTEGEVTLEELFSRCNVVCLCCKTVLQGPNRNVSFINDKLMSMSRDMILVNLANHLLVDTDSLVKNLSNGNVRAYSVEGTAELNPKLQQFPQVHFAPANAWNSEESMENLRSIWVSNVISAITGDPVNVYV